MCLFTATRTAPVWMHPTSVATDWERLPMPFRPYSRRYVYTGSEDCIYITVKYKKTLNWCAAGGCYRGGWDRTDTNLQWILEHNRCVKRGIWAKKVLHLQERNGRMLEEVLRQKERQGQKWSTGINRARLENNMFWEDTGTCHTGLVNYWIWNNKRKQDFRPTVCTDWRKDSKKKTIKVIGG